MKLIAGLGNPGPQYEGTRHNVGFAVLDSLARRHARNATAKSKFHGLVLDAEIETQRALLLKPLTYMNLSGTAIAEAIGFYKLAPATDLLVIVDDIALPCGFIRMRGEGSAGGHNGLADIEQKLGTTVYARLRIGIDGPGAIPQKDYVTGQFRPDQKALIEPALAEAASAAACWAAGGLTDAMNRFNSRKSTASTTDS